MSERESESEREGVSEWVCVWERVRKKEWVCECVKERKTDRKSILTSTDFEFVDFGLKCKKNFHVNDLYICSFHLIFRKLNICINWIYLCLGLKGKTTVCSKNWNLYTKPNGFRLRGRSNNTWPLPPRVSFF